jgi:hypothetical protein
MAEDDAHLIDPARIPGFVPGDHLLRWRLPAERRTNGQCCWKGRDLGVD